MYDYYNNSMDFRRTNTAILLGVILLVVLIFVL